MRRRVAGRSLGLALAFGVLASAGAGSSLALENAMIFGKPEVGGLRAAASDVSRNGDIVSIHYTLTWTDRSGHWRLNREEPVNITFWQSTADSPRRMSIDVGYVSLPAAFLAHAKDVTEATLRAKAPAGAVAVSLALGTSGLETERIALPPR